jgi:glutamyl-Q tRNA(Asp) synthetase
MSRDPAACGTRPPPRYRGRFAPSPTGPLHFGSLVAALAGWLDARAAGGEWLVRIEDLDRPRTRPGAADGILRTLAALGLDWDGEVLYQSARGDHYRAALEALRHRGSVYPCACTRTEISDSAAQLAPDGAPVYPGTCRAGLEGRSARALRVLTDASPIGFEDRIQGKVMQVLERDVGDFVLWRADGLYAYQLAVVVDDCAQGITDIVRGADLLDSTPRQIHLQHLLGCPEPRYAHVPVALDAAGLKLSKQTGASALDPAAGGPALARALAFLGCPPPQDLTGAAPQTLLDWGRRTWSTSRVPRRRGLPLPSV